MKNQQAYRSFCETQQVPLFMQPFWLDMAAGDSGWDAVLARNVDGAICGAWAFATGVKFGVRWVRLPVITPFTGIWLNVPEGLSIQKEIARRHEILASLGEQLPKAGIIELKVQWTLQDWLPFYWLGYRQETRYTFRFDHVDPETILNNTSKSFRRNLRVAERHYQIEKGKAEDLYPMMERVFEMRESVPALSKEMLAKVVGEMRDHNQGELYTAVDADGPQAAVFLVWDNTTTYYLIGGRQRTDSRHGTNLLLWQALQDTAQRGQAFDFEGSMIEGVNRFFQNFGAQLTPYHFLYKYRGIARLKYLK